MIIDATRYDAKDFAPVCLPSTDAMAKVERDWSRYGIARGVSINGAKIRSHHEGHSAAKPQPNEKTA